MDKRKYTFNNKHANNIKVKSIMRSVIIFAILFFLNSCQNEEFFYSNETKLAETLFNLSENEINTVSCRINRESKDSLFSPPVIEQTYKIVGVIYLSNTYKIGNIKKLQIRNVLVCYPDSVSIHDWSTNIQWSHKLMRDAIRGEIYYSHSLHALYFEVYYAPS